LEEDSIELNRGYLKYRRSNKPWVLLKFAQTIDGRIAASTGDARWISSDASLELAHQLRAESDAILVGINTALQDDPELTVRRVPGCNPYRVVLDPTLKISPDAKIFKADTKPVYIATQPYPPQDKAEQLTAKGAEFIWLPPGVKGTLDLDALLTELGQKGIHYLLVEGGGNVLSSFIQRKLCDEIVVVTAPKILGGDGIPCIAPMGITKVANAVQFEVIKREEYGPDLAVWYRPRND
ncbi:MAG: RibD family protein, partial [bacterium]